jgi:hypothetical protein
VALLEDLLEDWEENGPKAIRDVIERSPYQYLKIAATFVEKSLDEVEETNACIAQPDFQRLAPGVLRQNGRNRLGEVFLKASWACESLLGCCGLTESRT